MSDLENKDINEEEAQQKIVDKTPETDATREIETEAIKDENYEMPVNNKKKGKNRLILIIIIIGIILLVKGGLELFGQNSAPRVDEKEFQGQIELNSTGISDFIMIDKYIVVCDTEGLKAYDDHGKLKWNYDISIASPLLRKCEDMLLSIDTTRNNAKVFNKKGKLQSEIDFGSKCISATINNNGYVTAILKAKGYKAQVAVFDDKGTLKYYWNSANNNVISAELANDNTTLAVTQIDTSASSEAKGVVSLFDITSEGKPYCGKVTDSNIVSYIRWSGDNLICVGGKYTYKMDKNGKELWKYEYPGEMLMYNAKSDDIFVFTLRGDSTSAAKITKIYTVNSNGKQLGFSQIEGDIKGIEVAGNKIDVISSNAVLSVGKNAKIKKIYTLSRDISKGYLFPSGDKAFVVSGTTAEILSIN